MNKQLMKDFVNYIEHSNNTMTKLSARVDDLQQSKEQETAAFHEKLASSLGVLEGDGSIPAGYAEILFNQLKDNPEKVAEFLLKVNDQPKKTGEPSGTPQCYGDAIADFCFG